MSMSQAAIARLEAGGVGATLTTVQQAAAALELEVTVQLLPGR
jgi:predicted transcriptional regulator